MRACHRLAALVVVVVVVGSGGFSPRVLGQAVQSPSATKTITFENVLVMLQNGIDEEIILARLVKSPTVFTLGADQEQALRAAGATDRLLAAMKGGRPAEATPEPISDLAIVFDVSASMSETTRDGESKMAVAKAVMADLVARIPAGLNVSLTVYGHRPGCSAVETIRPLAEFRDADRGGLSATVHGLVPTGNTPLALALKRVGEQFAGRQSYCGVVLVTDGLESCNGDPVAEAARLAENPWLKFGVNVVGFGLKAEEDASTGRIATAGRGRYYSASDRAGLAAAIADVTKKLEKGAKPAPLSSTGRAGYRAIVVRKPEIEYPRMKAIELKEPGSNKSSPAVVSAASYDQELRQASPANVDLWWVPEAGLPVKLLADVVHAERDVRELRMEAIAGMIRVTSEAQHPGAEVAVTKQDDTLESAVIPFRISGDLGIGQDVVVPPGRYNVWLLREGQAKYEALEQGLEVKPGEVTVIRY
ncbi:MAG: vWA domain-containing protein [Planctomycetia bacterium]